MKKIILTVPSSLNTTKENVRDKVLQNGYDFAKVHDHYNNSEYNIYSDKYLLILQKTLSNNIEIIKNNCGIVSAKDFYQKIYEGA